MNAVSPRHYADAAAAPVRTFRADDGCALALHVLGDAAARDAAPVLFIHALAMDGRMWTEVARSLDAAALPGGRYALDCRGHGASATSAPPFTTARFNDDIACVLDALEAPAAHLVGCSMGGTVALAFAARRPERVASLTVIDSTAWYGPEAPEAWEARAQKALGGGMAALTEFQRARWFSPAFLAAQPALVQEAVDVFLRNRVDAYVATCRMLGTADERAGLAHYRGPTAVVVGEEDYATPPAMSEALVAALPDARLEVLAGLRHYTPLEDPAAIARAIEAVAGRARA